jgi:hypothetical protein
MKLILALLASLLLGTPALAAGNKLGLGLDVGSEAPYGNGVVFHWQAFEYSELNAGIGYNSTGAKVGIGHAFLFNITRTIGLSIGNTLAYSGGRDGEVEVDARFTPEGSDSDESMTATKSYELSPSVLFGFAVGPFWDLFKWLRLEAAVCYDVALTGNEVTLGKDVSYSEDVEVTNQDEFNDEFDDEAEKIVKAGGFGFLIGAQIRF